MNPSAIKEIGLLTPYNGCNLGDGAIQTAVIEQIKVRLPDVELTGFSLNPENTQKIHGIPFLRHSTGSKKALSNETDRKKNTGEIESNEHQGRRGIIKSSIQKIPLVYPALRSIKYRMILPLAREIQHIGESCRALKNMDLLIASGGGQIDDFWGGPWEHPYTLLKWAVICRLTRTRFLFLSVGYCSLDHRLSRLFVKFALRLAHYRSYRDEGSKNLMAGWKFTTSDPVYPDLAFSFENGDFVKDKHSSSSSITIGINPMIYGHPDLWPEKNPELHGAYIQTLVEFCRWLMENDHRVVFFSTGLADRKVIEEMASSLKGSVNATQESGIFCPPIQDAQDILNSLADIDLIVATRLHSVILPFLMYKPVVAVSYDRKVETQMADMGQGEYCLDIETFDTEQLIDRFQDLFQKREAVSEDLVERTRQNRSLLNKQYDEVLLNTA